MRTVRDRPSIGPCVPLGGAGRRLLVAAAAALLLALAAANGAIEGHLAGKVENRGNTFSAAADLSDGPEEGP